MSQRQNINAHLERFSNNVGLGSLSLNDADACTLCFDDTMIVNIEYLDVSESLALVATVTTENRDDSEFYQKLLMINLQHNNMLGAFLALNETTQEIFLIRSLPASLDFIQFESMLEKFVNSLEWCIAEVKKQSDELKDTGKKPSKEAIPPSSLSGGIKV